jgi:hypothetical protein
MNSFKSGNYKCQHRYYNFFAKLVVNWPKNLNKKPSNISQMSRQDRVIFFSKRDLMAPHMLAKAEVLLDQTTDFSSMDLNSLLEFHHIQKYFENEIYLVKWTADQTFRYKEIVKKGLSELQIFLLNIKPENIIQEIGLLEHNNQENFWDLLRYYELYGKLDRQLFVEILAAYPIHIRYILILPQLVQHFNAEIRTFLLNYEESAELLLGHFEQKRTDEPSAFNFPKSLTDADKEAIIDRYLDSDEPNLNYIDLVRNARHIKLSTKVRLKAKQTSARIKEEILNDSNSTRIGVAASLAKDQEQPVIFEKSDANDTVAIYGGLYLDSLKTDIELFDVFRNLFIYTDEEGLISLVNKSAEMGTLEKIFMQSKSEYQKGVIFERKNMFSIAQLGIFSHYLKSRDYSIELLLENFVHAFFVDWFGLNDLVFKMPQPDLSPAEKIRVIAPEMEYLLKQFNNFAIDGSIDHELLQMDSSQVHFSAIPSLVKQKYIFSEHQTIKELQHYFFDPESILADRKNIENRQTVFHKLATQKTFKSDFEDYQQPYLERAMQDGYLHLQENGVIEMVDPVLIFIAGKLKKNGFISYWHISEQYRTAIDELVVSGYLKEAETLFTSDEVSYLNFYLNMKEFSNGKDLRNKYLHGSNDRDIKQQELDYLYFLRTLILIMLKLRDDMRIEKT